MLRSEMLLAWRAARCRSIWCSNSRKIFYVRIDRLSLLLPLYMRVYALRRVKMEQSLHDNAITILFTLWDAHIFKCCGTLFARCLARLARRC